MPEAPDHRALARWKDAAHLELAGLEPGTRYAYRTIVRSREPLQRPLAAYEVFSAGTSP